MRGEKTMAKTPEGEVKDLINSRLQELKIYPAKLAGAFPEDAAGWYYMPAQTFGVSGIPDYLGHYYGTFWAIEAKAPGKKPSGFQSLQIEAIKISGGAVFVVDGEESLEKFVEFFERAIMLLPRPLEAIVIKPVVE